MINEMYKNTVPTIKHFIISVLALFVVPGCASHGTQSGSPVYDDCVTEQGTRSPGTFLSDTVLMARVKSKLMSDDMMDATRIHIKVRHGVVYLDGWVDDAYQNRMARDLARSIDGVVRVVSRLRNANPGTVFIKP